MKTLRNFIYAMAVAAAVTFCAPNARAILYGFTTNYDVINIAATIGTNIATNPKPGISVTTIHKFTLNNAAILSLLEGADWHNATFPPGAKLVVSWDAGGNVVYGAYGDILVVDKTGTNVLYDASEEKWSISDKAFMSVNFYYEFGDWNNNVNINNPGHYDFTENNNTSFVIYDGGNSYMEIYTYGPSTEISAQNWKNFNPDDRLASDFTSWSDSERATTYGAGGDVEIGDYVGADVTVKISASGHGRGLGGYYYEFGD